MKYTERILGTIALVSYVLLQFDIPGFRILFLLSVSLLSMIYFLLSFFIINELPLFKRPDPLETRNPNGFQITASILFGILSSTALIGFVFTVNHYPDNQSMLYMGLIPLTILTFISIFNVIKQKDRFNMNLLIRGVILISSGVLLIIF
jgi:hypothetical protein